jgi:uncharacterized membrane protein YjjP (DUF1212 family)
VAVDTTLSALPDQPERPEHAFLLRVAELLHAHGTPAYRLERVLEKVARSLQVEGTFLSTPTSVLVSLGSGTTKRVHLLRGESGPVDLGKLVEFDELMEDVEHGRLAPAPAIERMEQIAAAPPRHPPALVAAAYGLASATAALFFGGGVVEMAVAAAVGAGIYALGRALPRRHDTIGIFEPLAAFLAAFVALVLARRVLELDDDVVTLAGLIVLLPGLSLTTSFNELATRHLVSGVARLAGAGAVFLTLLFGVALAWRLGDALVPASAPAFVSRPLPPWGHWAAAAVAPFAFGVLFAARRRELGIVFVASLAGYASARLGTLALGPDIGPFLGAFVVGLAGNAYARVSNRPALVPITPGILSLVPGSLGFRSLTSFLDAEALAGMAWAFQTGMVAISLVGGLLAANAVLPPRRVL